MHTIGKLEKCSCDSSWLRNETSQWLNKWLNSTQAAHQLRLALLMSNSTGALRLDHISSITPTIQQSNSTSSSSNVANSSKQSFHFGTTRNKFALGADSLWTSTRSRFSPTNLLGNFSHWSTTSHNRHQVNNNKNSNYVLKRRHQTTPGSQAPTAKTLATTIAQVGVQGPKGEQGARGDRGERGDKGEPGLSSVKDRDALFQLEQDNNNKQQSMIGRLIYVESEQFLVLGTSSGWRPLLLAPMALRNYKQLSSEPDQLLNVAKHRTWLASKSNNDQPEATTSTAKSSSKSRRLRGPSNLDQPASPVSSASSRSRNSLWTVDSNDINTIVNNDDDDNKSAANSRDDDDLDDDDDEEDEDDDDDEADSLDSGDDEQDDEDEDDDENDDDDDEDVEVNQAKVLSPRHRAKVGKISSQQTPTQNSVVPSRRAASGQDSIPSGPIEANQVQQSVAQLKLRMIALNEPYSGNLHGIRGADFECKRQASRANIKGAFRSILATGGQNLADLVRPSAAHKSPIVNLRGEQLATSWQALLRQTSRLTNPLSRLYSFDGRHVATDSNWPNKLVWHGAQNKHGLRDPTNNCDAWHSDGLSKFGTATPIHNPRLFAQQNHHHHQDRVKALSSKKARRFLTGQSESTNFGSSGSIASARQHHSLTNNDNNYLNATTQSSTMFYESIDKFPCRMPLIVLCIETVAQSIQNTIGNVNDHSSNLI